MRFFLTALIFVSSIISSYCQEKGSSVTLLEKETKKPIGNIFISVQGFKTAFSNIVKTGKNGKAEFKVPEKCILIISSGNYKSHTDSIKPGEDKTIYLVKKPAGERTETSFDKVFDLKEVCITAQYTPTPIDKSIYDIKLIDREQIEQKGATTLSQLLANETNINIIQDNFIGSSNMVIQGLGGEHIKFLIDGVPMIGRMNGNIDLSQINLNDVDHIEIVDGPMSVQYGSNALGGAINIITKENKTDKLSADIGSYYESVGAYNINGGLNYKTGNNILNITGGRNFFDGFKSSDTLRSYLWSPKRDYFINGAYIYNKTKYKFKLTTDYFNDLLVDKGNLEPDFNYDKAWDVYHTTERFNNKAEFSYKMAKDKSINLTTAYSIYNQTKKTYLKDLTTLNETLTTNDGDQDTTKMNSLFLRGEFNRTPDSMKVNYQGGFDININNASGKRIEGNNQQIEDYAGYLTVKHNPFTNFTFQPGCRIAYNSRYKGSIIPSINFKYNFDSKMILRASYSRGFRAPEIKELFLTFYDSSHEINGNVDLKPEYSHNFSLSYNFENKETSKQSFRLEFKSFYNIINNIITLVPSDPKNVKKWSYVNIDNFKSLGANLNLRLNPVEQLSLNAGLSETGIFEDKNPEGNFSFSHYSFYNNINASVTYGIKKYNLIFSVYYKYTGKYPQMYYNSSGELVKGYINPFNNIDFSIMKNLYNDKLQLTVGAKNLLNNVNVNSEGSGAGTGFHASASNSTPVNWGSSVFVKVTYRFSKDN